MRTMKRSVFSIFLILAVSAALIPSACMSALAAAWTGGTTEPIQNSEGYYLIDTGEKLAWFSARVNAGYKTIKAKQTVNLDMGSRAFTPIGTATNKFLGVYDGGGYTIANLKVNISGEGAGLFGYIGATITTQTAYDEDGEAYAEKISTPAEINNITLTNANVSGAKNVGGIVGDSEGGYVTGCSVTGVVSATGSNVGGVVGHQASDALTLNCLGNATVTGTLRTGGVVGYSATNSAIAGCCHSGSVTGTSFVGGIVGLNAGSDCSHSYNKGSITGDNSCGGLVGYSTYGDLFCMFTIGTVNCNGEFRGIAIGNITYGTGVARVYYDRDHTTMTDDFATGAEYLLMQDDSFLKTLNFGFDIFVGDYFHTNDGYPLMRWQLIAWDGSVGEPETDANGVYLITGGNELAWFARLVNGTLSGVAQNRAANARVTRDILLNPAIFDEKSQIWTPIGNTSSPFIGTFDGGEYRISGIYRPDDSTRYSGLFGAIGEGGTVKNLFIEDSSITASYYAGAIAATNSGTIENCFNYSLINCQYYAGGIAGENSGTIRSCGNAGVINGFSYSGGITGESTYGAISSCFNMGEVLGKLYTGGIVGSNNATIQYCYNNGPVGDDQRDGVYIGGIVGYQSARAMSNGQWHPLTACYNIGPVYGGDTNIGGFCGYFANGSITYCYYDTDRSLTSDNVAIGKSTAQMAEPTSLSAFPGFTSTYWVDRGADQYFDYCPEIRVFYNSTNTLLKTTSKESAAVLKSSYTVETSVDGELPSYYASPNLANTHIGTGSGTIILLRNTSITEAVNVRGRVTLTDNGVAHAITRGTVGENAYSGNLFTVSGELTLEGSGAADTLTFNGGSADGMTGDALIKIGSTGTLTVNDGVVLTLNKTTATGGAIFNDGGTLRMKGGKVTSNQAAHGGGIFNNAGVVEISGGRIGSNSATTNGGGFCSQGRDAEVTISSVIISGNNAVKGGGVYVHTNSPATITGGTIMTNFANNGGGVYVAGILTLTGGTISGNDGGNGKGIYQSGTLNVGGKAKLATANEIYLPAGKTVTNTSRSSTDGMICNLTVASYAAGTRVLDGEYCASNYAKFVLNIPSGQPELHINSSGYLIAKEAQNVAKVSTFGSYDVYYTSLKEAVDAIGDGAGLVTMIADDAIEETITVNGDVTVTIQGDNAETRTLSRYRTCTGAMFYVSEGAALEFGAAGSEDDSALIVSGSRDLYGTYGESIVENHGTLRLRDGATLAHSSVEGNGGAIRNLGTLTVSGGRIEDCAAAQGGAVYNTGEMQMTGGTITDTSATKGGAVYNAGGTVAMQGGTISENSATDGGGVYNAGTLSFEGGTITANTATNGGGIYAQSGTTDLTSGTVSVIVSTVNSQGQTEYSYEDQSVTCTLTANSATYGGGLYVAGGDGTFDAGDVTSNTAKQGGGIYLAAGKTYTLSSGNLSGNTATARGNGIYDAGVLTARNCNASDDIYLLTGCTVIPAGTSASAVLTPHVPSIGLQVLSGSSVAALHSGFTVSVTRFFVAADGTLDTNTLSLKPSSTMHIDYDDGLVYGIDLENNNPAAIRGEFENAGTSLVFRDANGNILAEDAAVKTTDTLQLVSGGTVLDSKVFVLVGDVDGDGDFDGEDAVYIRCFATGRIGKEAYGAPAYRAADANSDGVINGTDVDLLRSCGLMQDTVIQPVYNNTGD